ncbi:hypothetical protein M2140_001802 [Clostridiales Family XIII bacterium PM5-7]
MTNISKHYALPEQIIEIINEVKEERGLKSEVAALTFIVAEYASRQSLSDEIVSTFNKTNKAWMERLRWGVQTAEQNSQVLMDAVNTILNQNDYEYCAHIEVLKNPVISQSEDKIKDRIAHFKQEKDNRSRKNKE